LRKEGERRSGREEERRGKGKNEYEEFKNSGTVKVEKKGKQWDGEIGKERETVGRGRRERR
jgi:hypothetical protein